jgi:hypothetical protein
MFRGSAQQESQLDHAPQQLRHPITAGYRSKLYGFVVPVFEFF